MRWVRRLAGALVAATVVAGPPAAVISWLTSAHVRRPGDAELRALLQDPLSSPLFLWTAALAGVGVLWLILTVIIVRQFSRRARRGWRWLRNLPLPSPAQATVGSVAGFAAFGMPGVSTPPAAPIPPPPSTPIPQLHVAPATTTPAAPPTAQAPSGVELPDGGWIPAPTARLIEAAVSLSWLRARRDYLPTPHRRAPRTDTDLQPVPPTAAAVLTATSNPAHTPPSNQPVTELIDSDQLPIGGLALDGPGAHDAARGLLVTTLLADTTDRLAVRAIATHADVAALLDSEALDLHHVRGLHLLDTLDAAATYLHDDAGNRHDSPRHRTSPLLLASIPTGRVGRQHLDDMVSGNPTAHLVITGAWPGHQTWYIAADGIVTAPGLSAPLRMCVLSARAAADLLTLLRQVPDSARQDRPAQEPQATADEPPNPIADNPQPTPAGRAHVAVVVDAPISLTLLGDCRLTTFGEPVNPRRAAALPLLAYLAIHPAGATARELTTAIWPGISPRSITNRLYTTISDLNTTLGAIAGRRVIQRRSELYHLDNKAITSDLWHLQAAAATASSAITSTDRAHADQAVINAYTGELAAGQTWPWLTPAREAIRRDVIDAYTALAEAAPAEDAVKLFSAATTVDPINEDLHRRTMTALAAINDQPAMTALHNNHQQRLTAAGLNPTQPKQGARSRGPAGDDPPD